MYAKIKCLTQSNMMSVKCVHMWREVIIAQNKDREAYQFSLSSISNSAYLNSLEEEQRKSSERVPQENQSVSELIAHTGSP